jgi:hypothetical protein
MFSRKAGLLLTAFVIALALLLVPGQAAGQSTAAYRGTVLDAQGAAVGGAKITVKNLDTGYERSAETDSTGNFLIPALPIGNYRIEIKKAGFKSVVVDSYKMDVGTTASQVYTLTVGDIAQTVEVTSDAPVIESSTMTVGQVINQRTVQDIPLNGRHFVDLALLIPGTVTPPANGFLTAPLRGQGSFAYNTAGNRETAINFMINGINLNDMVQNQVTFQPSINTVSEFKVDNSTYSAEYGRNSGSIVNIATRSGADRFHGEAYEFLRNEWFDARNAFNTTTITNGGVVSPNPIAPFKRNQFGGDFGGPIHKGTTYFFASYEGLRQRQGLSLASRVFPDSSATLTDITRATIQTSGGPVAKALLNLMPHANGTLNNTPAFFGSATAPVDIDQGTGDISHKFNDADQLHGYYVYQHDLRKETGATGGATLPGFGDTREGHRQVLTLNETHVFNANLVNEARLGANRIHITFVPNNTIGPASLGLGTALGANEAFMPVIAFNFSQLSGTLLGSERGFPQGRGDTTFVVADTLGWTRGRHAFRFGVEWRDFHNDNFNGDPGQITYNSPTNFQNDVADTAARTVGNVANRIVEQALDFFAVDSFKLRPYFTLELGLRYSWNMTPTEALNRYTKLVPVAGANSQIVALTEPYAQNNKNFQPRVGFAWDMFHTGKTVLRAGYGFQVDQPITGFVTGLTANPPFAFPVSVNNKGISTLSPNFGPFTASSFVPNLSPAVTNPNFKNANVQSWNLNVQQELGHTVGLMVGYFGSKGTHLEIDRNLNQFLTLGNALTRPFQSLSLTSPTVPGSTLANSITLRDSSGNSTYNALWVTANKRLAQGLQFNASYTWSHSIDDASRDNNGIVLPDSNNLASGRGPSDFDARHRFVINAIYDLPFKGNRFKTGWSVAPIVSVQSGNPFTIIVPSSGITGAGSTVTPIVVGPITVSGNPLGQWIVPTGTVSGNPSFANTFQIPTTTFGNMGRNAIVGPGFSNTDLALFKNTKITERVSVQFRADAFDLFNHPNYGQPSRTLSALSTAANPPTAVTSEFTISGTRFPTGDSGSSRQLQLAVKLIF